MSRIALDAEFVARLSYQLGMVVPLVFPGIPLEQADLALHLLDCLNTTRDVLARALAKTASSHELSPAQLAILRPALRTDNGGSSR
jgi:hypothetical protein